MDRVEAWQTNGRGPWAMLDGGVAIEVVSPGRHRVTWPGGEREVDGHDAALALAHERVGELSAD